MKPGMAIRHTFSTAAAIAVLAVACFVAGKVGLKVAFVNQYATTLSPTAGIALAALLLWGYRLWPGILAGAFLVHVTTADGATVPGTVGLPRYRRRQHSAKPAGRLVGEPIWRWPPRLRSRTRRLNFHDLLLFF